MLEKVPGGFLDGTFLRISEENPGRDPVVETPGRISDGVP